MMYLFKREDPLDQNKLQALKDAGATENIIDRLKQKITEKQTESAITTQKIKDEHNEAVAQELIQLANYIHTSVFLLRKSILMKEFISQYVNSSKTKSQFLHHKTVESHLFLLQKVTMKRWLEIKKVNGKE